MKSLAHLNDDSSEHAHQVGLMAWCAVCHLHGPDAAFAWAETGELPGVRALAATLMSSNRFGRPAAGFNQTAPQSVAQAPSPIEPWSKLEWLFAIPNGGSRGDGNLALKRGAELKAEGVKPGVADLMLPVSVGISHGLFIEMKKPTERPKVASSKGGLSEIQIKFGTFVRTEGYCYQVCYGWKEAADTLVWYFTI